MHVLFCSYGNDSIALIQWAHERGLKDVVCLYSDTGWSASWWANRVAKGEALAQGYGFTTARTKSEGMLELVKRKRGWPGAGGQGQFCTAELKVIPALEWLDSNDPDKEATAMTGVRRSESRHRSDAEEHVVESERHGNRELWQPLVRHTDEMRDALIHRAGFEVLPHRSLECYPCINANIDDIRLLSEDRIQLIDITEKDLGFTKKGKPRVMFRTASRKGAVGIRAVVQWAAAPRPRDQMELFQTECESGYCGG
ncbi:phosphoadenosine phosphosulfate reductase family protein [Pseudomonas sp. TH05]|uniref:phosphoadenosine phosphosulfate reductase domain-containing protein n=1 Tax=unclassified Pseudomonas TaxID=196821 RepID=UPI0019140DC5|nr:MULTISPECIES: phosphoadenosine phosphosulfate reductase family protein [unclassified Pseudomonas]MBK5541551.1 phosphoadenosine phosphosulfate reductase family protein [Pseudomonas sp. TH07]MBK5558170.1 phosphoadenosine phosphosulfate reductase family protein [Pseudomonas sp. TH05]